MARQATPSSAILKSRKHSKKTAKSKPMKAIKPTKCYLLDLPPEPRNMIMRFAIASDMKIKFITLDINDRPIFKNPPIACTCRQLRAEVLPVLHSKKILIMPELSENGSLGTWDEYKEWLQVYKNHVPFFRKIKMISCVHWHSTKIVIKTKRRSGSHSRPFTTEISPPEDFDRCQTVNDWSAIEVSVNAILSEFAQHGLTADRLIRLGDLILSGKDEVDCEELENPHWDSDPEDLYSLWFGEDGI